jgi:hypothetical protein
MRMTYISRDKNAINAANNNGVGDYTTKSM